MKDRSKNSLIQAAKQLYIQFGINKVTVEDICKEASVSKMTFYRKFTNKEEVTVELMNQLFEAGMTDFDNVMSQKIPFQEKISLLIQHENDHINEMGQFFVKDLYSNLSSYMPYLEKMENVSMAKMKDYFLEAQNTGELRTDISVDFMIKYLKQISEIVKNEISNDEPNDNNNDILNYIRVFFNGITGSK